MLRSGLGYSLVICETSFIWPDTNKTDARLGVPYLIMTYNFLQIQTNLKSKHSSASLCTNRGVPHPQCFDVAAQYFEKSSAVKKEQRKM